MLDDKSFSIEHVDAKGRPIGEGFDARARRAVDVASGVTRSWGRALVESEGYRKNIAGLAGGRIDRQVGIVVHRPPADEHKNIFESASATINLVAPDRQFGNPSPLPRRIPRIRDLLFPGTTKSNLVEVLNQDVRSNATAPVIEGGLIPESNVHYVIEEAPVGFIGTFITVSRQLFEDSDQVVAAIDGDLMYALQFAEDYQLLYGPGGTGYVAGMLAQATAFNPAVYAIPSATNIDTIAVALAQAATAEVVPDGIVMNAVDWFKIQTTKDGQGRYVLGSPYRNDSPNLFGVPVVPTMAMSAGTFLAGAFQEAATFYERSEIDIEVATQDQADFTSNQVKIRASERAALAVRRPQALITGTFPA